MRKFSAIAPSIFCLENIRFIPEDDKKILGENFKALIGEQLQAVPAAKYRLFFFATYFKSSVTRRSNGWKFFWPCQCSPKQNLVPVGASVQSLFRIRHNLFCYIFSSIQVAIGYRAWAPPVSGGNQGISVNNNYFIFFRIVFIVTTCLLCWMRPWRWHLYSLLSFKGNLI